MTMNVRRIKDTCRYRACFTSIKHYTKEIKLCMAIYQIESLNLIIKTNTTNKTKKCKVPHAKKKTKLISLFMTLFTFNLYVYDRKTFIYRVLTMDIEYPESTYTFKHILASYYRCFCFSQMNQS